MTRKPTEAVKGAHVVVTDTWVRYALLVLSLFSFFLPSFRRDGQFDDLTF